MPRKSRDNSDCVYDQQMKVYRNCLAGTVVFHLSLSDHRDYVDAGENDARTPGILEFDDAIDGAVILLDIVIQVLDPPEFDQRRPPGIQRRERSQIRATLVDRHCLGLPVAVNRFLDVAARRGRVTMIAQQEIDRVAQLVDGTVQVLPLLSDLDVCLVHPPARAHLAFVLRKCLFDQGHEPDDPAVYARMVELDTALDNHIFEIARGSEYAAYQRAYSRIACSG